MCILVYKYCGFLRWDHSNNFLNIIKFLSKMLFLRGSSRRFRDDCSRFGFLGNFPSVEAVREQDKIELKEVGGNYKEIADRMGYFLHAAIAMHNIILYHPQLKGKLSEDYEQREQKVRKEEKIGTLEDGLFKFTRTQAGFMNNQECPFWKCKYTWNHDFFWINTKTNANLTVNHGTVHLACKHHLLEKSPPYKIGAKEFYDNFMYPQEESLDRLVVLEKKYKRT